MMIETKGTAALGEDEVAMTVKKDSWCEDCPAGVFIDRTKAVRQVTRRKIFKDPDERRKYE